MQPKLLWSSAGVMILGIAAGFYAVDYASRNPSSLLARYGVVAFFAGFNPNPLCDPDCVVSRGQTDYASPGVPGQTIVNENVTTAGFHPFTSTIEPIQIEALPPTTVEPPILLESEWRPMSYFPPSVVIDETPIRMPYAEETLCEPFKPDQIWEMIQIVRSCGSMWFKWCFLGPFCVDAAEEAPSIPDPGVQLIDPRVRGTCCPGCWTNACCPSSWDLRNLSEKCQCNPDCPLMNLIRACTLPFLGFSPNLITTR